MAAFPVGAQTKQAAAGTTRDRSWTGTVTCVNAQDNTLRGKRGFFTKTFDLGGKCPISTVDKKEAALSDLRPGERVTIHYQDVEGVLVARRIAEKPLHYAGTVHNIDSKAGIVTMEETPLYQPFHGPRTFHIASDCQVVLWNGHEETLADLQPGDKIVVTYDRPGGSSLAYRIQDRSLATVATLETIDLPDRIVKAKDPSGEQSFALADRCRIILNGHKNGELKDLVAGQTYKFTYEAVNGINVLDRIAPASATKSAQTASTM